jgi:hypothetical protein
MKVLLSLCLGLALFSLTMASPVSLKGKVKPLVTQGGEDPDPEIQTRRNFVKQVKTEILTESEVSF